MCALRKRDEKGKSEKKTWHQTNSKVPLKRQSFLKSIHFSVLSNTKSNWRSFSRCNRIRRVGTFPPSLYRSSFSWTLNVNGENKKISQQNRKVMAKRNEMTVAKSFPYFYLLYSESCAFFLYVPIGDGWTRRWNGGCRLNACNANERNDMNKLYECGQVERKIKSCRAHILIGDVFRCFQLDALAHCSSLFVFKWENKMQSENKKPWKNHIEIKQPIWRDEEKGNARVSSKW